MLTTLRIEGLAALALPAAEEFYACWLPEIRRALGDDADGITIVLPWASYDHSDWRRAAARDLARAHAPKRVNLVAGEDCAALDATIAYLDRAPGVTGQYLIADGAQAPDVTE